MPELHQIVILAWDVPRLAEFYRDVVGLKVIEPSPGEDLEEANWVAFDAGGAKIAIHGGGVIRGSGSVLISLKVEDLEFTYWDLKKRGVDVQRPREVWEGVRVARAHDPEGNIISFEQIED